MRRRTSNRLSLLMLRPAPLASALLDTLRTVRGVSMIDCSLFGMVEDCQLRMPPHSVCEGLGALPEEFPTHRDTVCSTVNLPQDQIVLTKPPICG